MLAGPPLIRLGNQAGVGMGSSAPVRPPARLLPRARVDAGPHFS
jgi:hypothetical protein